MSGSVGKVANLGVPDIVLSNMSDVVDHCRRITRIAEVSLMVDAEDGFGNAVNVHRTVRELEAAGVSAIEVEDNVVPKQFNMTDPGLVSTAEQVGKLRAAVAARSDPATVIVARSAAFGQGSVEDAQERLRAYSATGAEAVMLTGIRSREQLEAAHEATALPLCILAPPADARNDPAFSGGKRRSHSDAGQPGVCGGGEGDPRQPEASAGRGALEDLADAQASPELLRNVNRTGEFMRLQEEFLRS